MTQMISVGALIATALFVFIAMIVGLNKKLKRITTEQTSAAQLIAKNKMAYQILLSRLDEAEASIHTLHKIIQPLPEQINQLEGTLREQLSQDPQVKLYQKAAAMAKQGVGAEEIAQACDLPVAEVSVLISLHT
ncbi:DUF2802 domain-containing protein [Alteromonas sp. 5E99-2]|uniref:DUF2802 domain-containing protein n=1 Tax=Alteromonas sp. 5E99-2 TaxID=2817683 RepID=UPI001A98B05B|nr:DUF2802 domain-containing protein [Alteromonas sp. 5E99-2]MBO1255205.1 DUF2802 domain-containing protein [Alteromonas sp. 5E99-2]